MLPWLRYAFKVCGLWGVIAYGIAINTIDTIASGPISSAPGLLAVMISQCSSPPRLSSVYSWRWLSSSVVTSNFTIP
jgi:hypothetical protein